MTNQTIPAEAINAAAKAYIDASRPIGLAEIEEILEAAAPYMLADAWDAGGEAAIEREHAYGREEKAKFSNPYRADK